MRRRHPNAVRGGGSDALCGGFDALSGGSGNRGEGAQMQPTAKARVAPAVVTESRRASTGEGRPGRRPRESRDFLKDGGAGPWAADGLTVAAHQAKAVEEEGTQITLSSLY